MRMPIAHISNAPEGRMLSCQAPAKFLVAASTIHTMPAPAIRLPIRSSVWILMGPIPQSDRIGLEPGILDY